MLLERTTARAQHIDPLWSVMCGGIEELERFAATVRLEPHARHLQDDIDISRIDEVCFAGLFVRKIKAAVLGHRFGVRQQRRCRLGVLTERLFECRHCFVEFAGTRQCLSEDFERMGEPYDIADEPYRGDGWLPSAFGDV